MIADGSLRALGKKYCSIWKWQYVSAGVLPVGLNVFCSRSLYSYFHYSAGNMMFRYLRHRGGRGVRNCRKSA